MKKLVLKTAVGLAVASVLNATESLNIHQGWQLLGSSNDINVTNVFNKSDIKTVWIFDRKTQSWKAYSPDSNLMQLINDNANIGSLDYIAPNSGFWVYATGDDTIDINDSYSYTNNGGGSYDDNYSNKKIHFAKTLQSVQPSDLAGKTFKIPYQYEKDDEIYKTISFNNSAEAKISEEHHMCYNEGQEQNTTTITVNFEVVGDKLKISSNNYYDSENNNSREYKILAKKDGVGIVFGAIDISESEYIEWKGEFLPPVFVMINDSAEESPVDMSKLTLPLTVYHTWDANSYTVLESNGSVVEYYDGHMNDWERGTFEVNDKKIAIHQTHNWDRGGGEHNFTVQTIFKIGDFNIDKEEFSGYWYDTVVGYNDENNSWSKFNLTANPDVDTWQKFFAKTNWTLYDTKYYENNNTTNHGGTFSISSDGKILTTKECGYEHNQTIQSGKISHHYSGTWIGISSTVPIYTVTTNGAGAGRKNTAKQHKLPNFLPYHIKKVILHK